MKHVRREDNLGAGAKKKYEQHLDKHVPPAFRGRKLSDITTAALDDFLSGVRKEDGGPLSYWTKVDLKNLLSSIFTKAHDWGYWKDRNPVEAATVGKKRWARERRILTDENTVALLEVLPHVLQVILKTLDCTGMRISELLGLRWKHVNTDTGWLRIEERYYRGDIDVPKTEGSVREVPLGELLEDYRRLKPAADPEDHVFARTDGSGEPLWDSGIRKTLKAAARELKIDFPGFGMHSFRRGLVTKFQEVGGTAIEAQKTAGHSKVDTTSEYIILQRPRQEEIVRRVQARWNKEQQVPGPEAPAAAVAGGNSSSFRTNSAPRRDNVVVMPTRKGA